MTEKAKTGKEAEYKITKKEIGDLYDRLAAAERFPKAVRDILFELLEKEQEENVEAKLAEAAAHLENFLDQELDEGVKERVRAIKERIDNLLRIETKFDRNLMERFNRDMETAAAIDSLENGGPVEKVQLAAILERRQWGNVFSKLHKGDRVLTFLVPGADFLKVKYLNDEIFGPQITDQILAEKRQIIAAEINGLGVGAEVLWQDYKSDGFGIPEGAEIDPAKLEEAAASIDRQMVEYISKLAEEAMKTADAKKKKKLEVFLSQLRGSGTAGKESGRGFRVNYGLNTVEGDSIDDKLLGLNGAMEASLLSRGRERGYGAEFSKEDAVTEVAAIGNLRNRIMEMSDNAISNSDGISFQIFIRKGDRWQINKDLLRDIRKEKFISTDAVLDSIKLYVKKLNLFDNVKPFTYNRVKSGELAEDLARNEEARVIVNSDNPSVAERKKAAEILKTGERNPEFMSEMVFGKTATEMNNVEYLDIDILDLGVDLLLEYEQLLQEVENAGEDDRWKKFQEASLVAGDATTANLLRTGATIAEIYKKYGLDGDRVVGSSRGDEFRLAIDRSKLTADQLEDMIFEIKERTNTRVVKTLMGETVKQVGPNTGEAERRAAHLNASKRAEKGTEVAKELEALVRKMTWAAGKERSIAGGLNERLRELRGLVVVREEEGNIKVEATNYVVGEINGEFMLTGKEEGGEYEKVSYSISYDRVKEILEQMSAAMEAQLKQAAA